ncbi:MAG: hypothetical protein IH971_09935 [Candidatus Marinimicrobia bacterium]|nr:hypothetical protein [Candidatus Neomarinimicrobiota bacterium]
MQRLRPLHAALILVLLAAPVAAQDYFYDAKYVGERIHLVQSNDEILVKFGDGITDQALAALSQEMQLDIRSKNLDRLRYARLGVPISSSFDGILLALRQRPDVKRAIPVLIDQYGGRRVFVPGQFTVQFVEGLGVQTAGKQFARG